MAHSGCKQKGLHFLDGLPWKPMLKGRPYLGMTLLLHKNRKEGCSCGYGWSLVANQHLPLPRSCSEFSLQVFRTACLRVQQRLRDSCMDRVAAAATAASARVPASPLRRSLSPQPSSVPTWCAAPLAEVGLCVSALPGFLLLSLLSSPASLPLQVP